MRRVYSQILKAAETDSNVIIYSETGCGKDLAAKSIHEYSGGKGRYVPVNCGAIPEQLLESEFFWHVKGAFSGAHANKEGYIGAANGGTLLLVFSAAWIFAAHLASSDAKATAQFFTDNTLFIKQHAVVVVHPFFKGCQPFALNGLPALAALIWLIPCPHILQKKRQYF